MPLFPLILCAAAFLVAGINAFTMRTVKADRSKKIESSVAVLIPMRNEERNARPCVDAVLASTNCSQLTISVLDDSSTDATRAKLEELQHSITILSGAPLPSGWVGKSFALSQLAAASTAEYLIFIDADVRLAPEAISATVALAQAGGWDFLSPYPRQIARTLPELLIQPLLQWSWLSSVLLRIAERFPRPSTTIANGQFFMVKRSAYEAIGGHENIKNEVLDDLELARELVRHGYCGAVADGSEVASCRMYENFADLQAGYTKSLWRAFGSLSGTILTILILTATGILPFFAALHGSIVGMCGALLVLFSRLIASIKTRSNPLLGLLHPLAIIFLIYLIALSWWKKYRGTLMWRERTLA